VVAYLPARARTAPRTDALFVNRRGGRLTDRSVRTILADRVRQVALAKRISPTPCVTASPPTSSAAAPTCEPSRSYWAMRASRRRNAIRM
jgi:hypothetical protein